MSRVAIILEDELRAIIAHALREALAEVGPPAEEELLTSTELSKILKISEDTVRRWARVGCPHVAAGERSLRFRKADVFAWLEKRGRA